MGKLKALSWYSMTPGARIRGLVRRPVEDHGGFAEVKGGPHGPNGSRSYVHFPSPLCPLLLGPGRQVEGYMTSLKVLGQVFLKGLPGLMSLIMNTTA